MTCIECGKQFLVWRRFKPFDEDIGFKPKHVVEYFTCDACKEAAKPVDPEKAQAELTRLIYDIERGRTP